MSGDRLERAVETLRSGGTVIYPTETVYGVGADALDAEKVERVYEVKRRSRDKPVSLAVSGIEEISRYAEVDEDARRFVENFLPGPITVVLKKRDVVPDVLTSGSRKVGVRVPSHEFSRRLASEFGPVTSTSANISGNPSATSMEELDEVTEKVDAVIRGECGEYTEGSTVVDATEWEIIRRGPRDVEESVGGWIEERS